jgi:hypothetical protein
MANRERGEIRIEIAGKSYTLVLNTNGLIALQDACSTPKAITPIEDIYAAVMQGSLRHVRAFLWAALQKYHPQFSLVDVGDLIDQAGGITGMGEIMQRVQRASEPDAADARELAKPGAGANPPKARVRRRRGTGDVFSSMPAKSA